MISSRIIEVVTNLSDEQLNRLADFLNSPYHNSGYNSQKIIELFELVKSALSEDTPANLEKAKLNQHFYPDRPFVEKKKNPIDALSSDLFAKMKDFLFFEHVQSPKFAAQQVISLASFYRLHNYEERFWQLVKQFRKNHASQGNRDANYYLDSFLLEAEVATFCSTFNTYTDDANIAETDRCLDQFYATQKLETTTILAFQRKLSDYNTVNEKQTASLIVDVYQDYPSFHTLLAGYYKTILTWLSAPPTPLALEDFVVALKAKKEEIEAGKFRNLMAFYRYFLSLQYHREATGVELLQKLFNIFKEHLEEGYLQVNGKLMPATLKSMINLATKLGEISWAKEVLRAYPYDHITGTRYPEEAHSLCEAEVLFANGEYQTAQEKLIYCNFENVNYSILADVLLIKIYYVQQDELIYNRISALEKKVRRSKLSAHNKSAYIHFLHLLLRVLKYEHNKQSKKWTKLQDDLQHTKPMLEREWLEGVLG
ncbi:hypothetical protein [Lewinella sp. LCG006]|uniref:hypothetical protein n=1 Tax=Lewinella sp. LCG006 TaxID=3231911 RepID=UPI0034611A89